jgi:hypothetical protein
MSWKEFLSMAGESVGKHENTVPDTDNASSKLTESGEEEYIDTDDLKENENIVSAHSVPVVDNKVNEQGEEAEDSEETAEGEEDENDDGEEDDQTGEEIEEDSLDSEAEEETGFEVEAEMGLLDLEAKEGESEPDSNAEATGEGPQSPPPKQKKNPS